MNIKREEIHYEASNQSHWTRIYFELEDGSKSSVVLVSASRMYLMDCFKLKGVADLDKNILNKWIEPIEEKWRAMGDSIFQNQVHYNVHSFSEEGRVNGMKFLKKNITP